MKLDHIDLRILKALSRDSSITNKALASAVGLSASACRERVLRLERAGAILGYRAILSNGLALTPFEGWVCISLSALPISTHNAVADFIGASHSLIAAYQTSGAYDYLLHFAGLDEGEWRVFCHDLNAIGVDNDRLRLARLLRRVNGSAASVDVQASRRMTQD